MATPSSSPASALRRLQLLEGYLREDPDNAGLMTDVVHAAVGAGSLDRAEALIQRLHQLQSGPQVDHLEGYLRLAQHRFEEAAVSFERVLSRAPTVASARFNVGYALFRMGNFHRAADVLRPLLNNDAAPPQTLAYLLRALHHAGHPTEALDVWRDAGRRFSTPETLGVASLACLDANQLEEAAHLSQQALNSASPPLEASVVRATLAIGDGAPDVAVKTLEEAMTRYPDDGRVWSAMAAACMLKGDIVRALDAFRNSTRLLPQHVGAWVSQAWCQILMRDLEGAQISLRSALECDRNFAETHGTLAVVAALRGQRPEAQRAAEVALRLDPSCLAARYAESVLNGQAADPQGMRVLARRLLQGRVSLPVTRLLERSGHAGG